MNIFSNKKKQLLRVYRAKRREQIRAYERHNELHPDQYGHGHEFKEYTETWLTVCRLRDELRLIAIELGYGGKRLAFK